MDLGVNKSVRDEIGEELKPILAAGFSVNESDYSEVDFGNFYVDLIRGPDKLRIVRDRNQYMVQGDEAKLKRIGLWRTFDSKEDFFNALKHYVFEADE